MDSFSDMVEMYKALADRTRLRMLALLAKDELCVCELVSVLHLSQPSVSTPSETQAGRPRQGEKNRTVGFLFD